ncbi:glycerophosphodiester phosphodiesterase 1 [Tribolium castaneum]|uniref:Glycerophosphodiester phosphodiesterase 1-like Protein n=1 Tax=Tribolium castaneum TaxID=7070 RepID=D6WBB2_TRICA|nr:PREDICTED: glycerophosphodiester phosphodiesterase 1 [Tribolium castaneum]EEZ98717.1 Glycerophosphodiester phosphodiesterase 1-like Protein [Tribolium castaneum]|eukprot:XP_973098.1 PREDICTED: glycerophosphodiester phosphodiesterase 1 [Tribolium castaneum]
MKHTPVINLTLSSLTIVAVFYGSWSLLTEVINTILPFGLILTILLVCAVYFLRVPAPSPASVETILGKDPAVASSDDAYVMKTVAHRGAGLDAPENSLPAFKMCHDQGCDAIEFDITLTKDGVPVVFHDNCLERMSDCNLVIGEHKWEDLCNIDISVKHLYKDRFAKTNIPTLEQTVTQLLASGQRMFIDIKDNNKKFVKIIHGLFDRYPDLYSRAVVSSFNPILIYLIRKGNPKIVCSLAWRPHAFAYDSFNFPMGPGIRRGKVWYKHFLLVLCDFIHEWALTRITYYLLGLSVILLHKDAINGRTVYDWRKRGLRVMAWTVNTPAEKQFLARVLKITYLTDTLTGEGTTHTPPL